MPVLGGISWKFRLDMRTEGGVLGLRRELFQTEIIKGRMFNWDVDTAWAEEYNFLGVGGDCEDLKSK